jgi:hypothetical protein
MALRVLVPIYEIGAASPPAVTLGDTFFKAPAVPESSPWITFPAVATFAAAASTGYSDQSV